MPAGSGSEEAQSFWMEHGEHLNAIGAVIGKAFKAKDGDTLLLMNAALRGLADQIVDGLAWCEIRIEGDDQNI